MTSPATKSKKRKDRIRLAYLVSHPIQYQAPLLRRIAQEPDIDLTVFFGSDFSVQGYKDEVSGVLASSGTFRCWRDIVTSFCRSFAITPA